MAPEVLLVIYEPAKSSASRPAMAAIREDRLLEGFRGPIGEGR